MFRRSCDRSSTTSVDARRRGHRRRRRWTLATGLLPSVSAGMTESRRKTCLEAFGFPLGPFVPVGVGRSVLTRACLHRSRSWISTRERMRASTHEIARPNTPTSTHDRSCAGERQRLHGHWPRGRAEAVKAQLARTGRFISRRSICGRTALVAGIDGARGCRSASSGNAPPRPRTMPKKRSCGSRASSACDRSANHPGR
jgi:hypothetical protein